MNHNIEIDDTTRNAIVICNEPLCFGGPRGETILNMISKNFVSES